MADEKQHEDFNYIVRVAGTDLDGKKSIDQALLKIKGVGFSFSNMVCSLSGIDRRRRMGDLSDEEVNTLDMVVRNPLSYGAPTWLLNHRKEPETGEDMHFIGPDLKFANENDIKNLKMSKSFKGLRHQWGLPLRGQRTASNFRANKRKGSLGVKRRKGAKGGRV